MEEEAASCDSVPDEDGDDDVDDDDDDDSPGGGTLFVLFGTGKYRLEFLLVNPSNCNVRHSIPCFGLPDASLSLSS